MIKEFITERSLDVLRDLVSFYGTIDIKEYHERVMLGEVSNEDCVFIDYFLSTRYNSNHPITEKKKKYLLFLNCLCYKHNFFQYINNSM